MKTAIRAATFALPGLLLAAAFFLWRFERRSTLPYHDRFAKNEVSEWTPYGGVWHLSNGVVTNRSDEGGAKLAMGSPDWTDYQVTADVQMNGYDGDVGIVVHVDHLRNGIDALRGYYATLRSETNALVLGVSDDDHLDRLPVRLQDGFRSKNWYRLHIVVVGCEVAAEAVDLATGKASYSALHNEGNQCFRSGEIALRSNYGGGSWKNVRVERANISDLQAIEKYGGPPLPAQFPIREADYARMWNSYFANQPAPAPEVPLWVHENEHASEEPDLIEIARVHSLAAPSRELRIRGTVTSASPVYVQDATGGIKVEGAGDNTFNVGDEIEAVGHADLTGSDPAVLASGVRRLWDRTPLAPSWITPAQASSGQLDGSLVELSGTLLSSERLADGSTQLHLESSSQTFTAQLQNDPFNQSSRDWSKGSTLRTRGICIAAADPLREGAFKLLVASSSDIQILSGPPWWSGWRLAGWIALALMIIAMATYAYIRGERAKMRAILKERERLAHDMHDTLAQSFAGVAYFLQGVRKSLVQGGVANQQVQDMNLACEMVASAHREASASIAALHPDTYKDGDLLNMLEHTTASMLEGKPLPISSQRIGTARTLSPTVVDVLFRVGREAIANVLRHAHATQLTLTLRFEAKAVCLVIADNGVGMRSGSSSPGFGLRGMRQRCNSIGATLEMRSVENHGSEVEVRAPYRRKGQIKFFLLPTSLSSVLQYFRNRT